MTMDFSRKGKCEISMAGYVEDILRFYGVDKPAASPASPTLFNVRDGAVALDKAGREHLHSAVAKILFLAKRARPGPAHRNLVLGDAGSSPDRE
jgi:hypothetical protein